METARRLGVFSLVLAFLLNLFYTQSEPLDLEWRDQLLVYSILFGLLGFLLVVRYRARGRKSSRFSGFKDFLFRNSRNKGQKPKQNRRTGRAERTSREDGEV